MKKLTIIFILLIASISLTSQNAVVATKKQNPPEKDVEKLLYQANILKTVGYSLMIASSVTYVYVQQGIIWPKKPIDTQKSINSLNSAFAFASAASLFIYGVGMSKHIEASQLTYRKSLTISQTDNGIGLVYNF